MIVDVTEHHAVCDSCWNYGEGCEGEPISGALKEGWHFVEEELLCPECYAERKKAEKRHE